MGFGIAAQVAPGGDLRRNPKPHPLRRLVPGSREA